MHDMLTAFFKINELDDLGIKLLLCLQNQVKLIQYKQKAEND